jgi:uncharacterized protein (TIGR02246 family)
MKAHPAAMLNASVRRVRYVRGVSRAASVSGAALAVALLLGCDDGWSDATAPTAGRPSAAPSASTADAFDHVGPRHGDEAGVAGVIAAWDAAWNAGDSDAIAATFVDDGELIGSKGGIVTGTAAIRAQNANNLATQFKGTRTEGHIRRITFLSGTAAVVDVDNTLWRVDGPVPTVLQMGRHKRLVAKRGNEWRVLQMQITLIAPTP